PQDNARFGAAVAASDGAFAVGAPEEGDGAAYRFTGELAQRSRLVPRAGETGYGLAVALSGDRFVVGAADTNNQAGAAVLESDPEKLFQSGYE
ncbi:MAG: hypothetical protein R3200_17820, partial [Xanthomonadales bacterium]|nr:hypothetical protein [Xanthomonadales bacterium]